MGHQPRPSGAPGGWPRNAMPCSCLLIPAFLMACHLTTTWAEHLHLRHPVGYPQLLRAGGVPRMLGDFGQALLDSRIRGKTWRTGRHVRRYAHGPGVPDVAAVVADCPVGGEETRACRVQDRHSGPPVLIGPHGSCPVVAIDVGPVVGQNHVLVLVEKRADDWLDLNTRWRRLPVLPVGKVAQRDPAALERG